MEKKIENWYILLKNFYGQGWQIILVFCLPFGLCPNLRSNFKIFLSKRGMELKFILDIKGPKNTFTGLVKKIIPKL